MEGRRIAEDSGNVRRRKEIGVGARGIQEDAEAANYKAAK